MNQLLDADLDDSRIAQPEHELTLGTGTILGIFFALSLVCAAFFGLGYVFGRHTQSVDDIAAASVPVPASVIIPANTHKPTAGETVPSDSASTPAEPQQLAPATVTIPTTPSYAAVKTVSATVTTPAAPALSSSSSATPGTVPASLPQTATNGAYMVQIAAVSTQQIADIEVTALRKFGYNVLIRHEPQDQLLHIQLGPYLTHKDAEAIRANVESHGFNAIIK